MRNLGSAKIEMLFLGWTSQNEDQQHARRNRESEVCRAEAVVLVHILHQACLAPRTGVMDMGRSIPLAIKTQNWGFVPFFCRGSPLRPRRTQIPHLLYGGIVVSGLTTPIYYFFCREVRNRRFCKRSVADRLSWKLTKN